MRVSILALSYFKFSVEVSDGYTKSRFIFDKNFRVMMSKDMVQMEITIKNHGLCSQRNILAENVPGMKAEQTVPFARKLLVRKVS